MSWRLHADWPSFHCTDNVVTSSYTTRSTEPIVARRASTRAIPCTSRTSPTGTSTAFRPQSTRTRCANECVASRKSNRFSPQQGHAWSRASKSVADENAPVARSNRMSLGSTASDALASPAIHRRTNAASSEPTIPVAAAKTPTVSHVSTSPTAGGSGAIQRRHGVPRALGARSAAMPRNPTAPP
ncbi:MAG: hypothetical protein RL591_2178 [Planctomycetota bacterium]